MLRTDIFQRGAPWAALLWRFRSAPADLNLNDRAKAATVSAALLAATLLLLPLLGYTSAVVPTLVLLLAGVFCSRLTRDGGQGIYAQRWKSSVALLIGLGLPILAFAWAPDPRALLPLLLVAVIVWAQLGFYELLSRQGGIGFAIAVVPLQVLFFTGNALAVPLGLLAHLRRKQGTGVRH